MNFVLRKSGLFAIVMLLGTMLCSISATAGSILYTTLGPGNSYDPNSADFVDGSNFNNQVVADQFTLGTGANVMNAMLALGNYAGGNNPLNLYIESNNGGMPGSILAQLTQVGTILPWGNGNGGGLVNFTCSGAACTLGPGSYWLVALEPDANTQQLWDYNYQDAAGNVAFNENGSATGPWISGLFNEHAFEIDGVPLPEPNILLILIPGLLGAAYGLRSKLFS